MPPPIRNLTRVLCVDDDEDAGEMLSLLLKSSDIEVKSAQSVSEAWLRIKSERFDLFVLETWLPEFNGLDFCRQIRESDSSTPILFYSGAAFDTDRQQGIAAGANAYVAKPDIDGLLEALRDLIARTRENDVTAVLPSSDRTNQGLAGAGSFVNPSFRVAVAGN